MTVLQCGVSTTTAGGGDDDDELLLLLLLLLSAFLDCCSNVVYLYLPTYLGRTIQPPPTFPHFR